MHFQVFNRWLIEGRDFHKTCSNTTNINRVESENAKLKRYFENMKKSRDSRMFILCNEMSSLK